METPAGRLAHLARGLILALLWAYAFIFSDLPDPEPLDPLWYDW